MATPESGHSEGRGSAAQPDDERRRRNLLLLLLALLAAALVVVIVLLATSGGSSFDDKYRDANGDLQRLRNDIVRDLGPVQTDAARAKADEVDALKRRTADLEARLRDLNPPAARSRQVHVQIVGTHGLAVDLGTLLSAVRLHRTVVVTQYARRVVTAAPYVARDESVPSTALAATGRASATPGAKQLKPGQAATLHATYTSAKGTDHYAVQVTLQKVVPISNKFAPTSIRPKGTTWIGVYAHLQNVGSAKYGSYKVNDTDVITSTGKQADREGLYGGPPPCRESGSGDDAIEIAPGKGLDVCVPYELKPGESAVAVRWALRPLAGKSLDRAEWSVK